MDSYNSSAGADEYIKFINSENGILNQELLYSVIAPRLGKEEEAILDAGCGTGYLTARLAKEYKQVYGCDGSAFLIDYAEKQSPGLNFEVCDLTQSLPYQKSFFSAVIINMAAHDVLDQAAVFKNIFFVLKPGSKLIMTIANPYYSYPVGVWKRGLLGRLLFKKPELKVRPYNLLRKQNRKFLWGSFITPYFYPLSEQINNALGAGFVLKSFEDVAVETDSKKFDLQYQLYRFPTRLLLYFEKPAANL